MNRYPGFLNRGYAAAHRIRPLHGGDNPGYSQSPQLLVGFRLRAVRPYALLSHPLAPQHGRDIAVEHPPLIMLVEYVQFPSPRIHRRGDKGGGIVGISVIQPIDPPAFRRKRPRVERLHPPVFENQPLRGAPLSQPRHRVSAGIFLPHPLIKPPVGLIQELVAAIIGGEAGHIRPRTVKKPLFQPMLAAPGVEGEGGLLEQGRLYGPPRHRQIQFVEVLLRGDLKRLLHPYPA